MLTYFYDVFIDWTWRSETWFESVEWNFIQKKTFESKKHTLLWKICCLKVGYFKGRFDYINTHWSSHEESTTTRRNLSISSYPWFYLPLLFLTYDWSQSKLLNGKFQKHSIINFKMHMILSRVLKAHAILPCPFFPQSCHCTTFISGMTCIV